MRTPVQPKLEEFLPAFFGALYGPSDRLRVAQLVPDTGEMLNGSMLRDDALQWITLRRDMQTPNLYFAAGTHKGGDCYTQADFASLPALFVDLDAGKGKPFRDIDDILAFLLTHPVQRATAAWVTGNGVQMCFLLQQPIPSLRARRRPIARCRSGGTSTTPSSPIPATGRSTCSGCR